MKNSTGWMVAVVLATALTGAYAATSSWTNTPGGSFQDAGNWNPNTVPGASDTAEFKASSASPYTVTFDDHVSVTDVTFSSGVFDLTLNLNGKTVNSAPNGDVGVCSATSVGTRST